MVNLVRLRLWIWYIQPLQDSMRPMPETVEFVRVACLLVDPHKVTILKWLTMNMGVAMFQLCAVAILSSDMGMVSLHIAHAERVLHQFFASVIDPGQ